MGILPAVMGALSSANSTLGFRAISDFRALTATEAIAAAGEIPTTTGIFPASWINANFDVWIGHAEDVAAWELLWDAREAYARAGEARKQGRADAPSETALKEARESLPGRRRQRLVLVVRPRTQHRQRRGIRCPLSQPSPLLSTSRLAASSPGELAKPIKRQPEHAVQLAPTGWLNVKVDGRDTSYFEWLGAGLYSPERRGGSMHGRVFYLHELRYGFEQGRFCVRIDPFLEQSSANSKTPSFVSPSAALQKK